MKFNPQYLYWGFFIGGDKVADNYVLSAELSLKDKFTDKIKRVGMESKKFQDTLDRLDRKFKTANTISGKSYFKWLGSGVVGATKIGISALDKYEKKIFTLHDKIKSLGAGAIKGIAGLGVAGAGASIGALKIGADFERYKSMMMTAVKGSKEMRKQGDVKTVAGDYYKWANNFANITPFTNDEVIQSTVRLASFGYDPKKLMTTLGDMAAARGTSLMQGIEAFLDAGVGEMERFKEYGITKEKITEFAKSKGISRNKIFSKNNEIINPQLFMETLVKLIQSETAGGMKDQENTLSGRFSTTLGLMKSNVAKMIGIMEDGEIRQGSFIAKVKESLGKLNSYLQSDKGKAAIDKWIKTFDTALPQIVLIFQKTRDKIMKIDFVKKFQESIDNFDPKNINTGLESVKKHFDDLWSSTERMIKTMIGFELGKTFGIKGALVGAAAGYFSDDIVEGINKYKEWSEKEEKSRDEKLNTFKNITTPPGMQYVPGMGMQPTNVAAQHQKNLKNITIQMNNPVFNNGTDIDTFCKIAEDRFNNGE